MSWLISRALMEAYANSPSSPGLVAEYLPGNYSDGEQSAQLNVMPTQHPFWRNDKTMDFSKLSQFGPTCAVLTENHGEELLMSFLAGFHAKTSALPEKVEESRVSAQDFGPRCLGLFARFDRDSFLWRTPQRSLVEGLDVYSETWPRWGLMRNGECWELTTWGHLTEEKGSGLWQTPVADDASNRKNGKWNSRGEPKLSAQVLMPTPTVHGNYNKPGASKNSGTGLATFARMFPTATATAHKGWSKNHNRANTDDRLDYTIEREASSTGQTGRLNPTWVEWLMGWPIGWTELKLLEMDRCHSVPLQRLGC
jgi:hypothetical protein